ncbi:MAG TPA: CC/Se motif family (seleno)protein [Clostridia bacterium]|nr:CC/Se motif family (seleno)protein [Clostridia bacterium]
MNIIIEKDAVEYIKKHSEDNSVILHIQSTGGNCCASVQSPAILLGKPEKAEKFDLYSVDEISVYLRKDIQAKNDGIRIFIRKFLWIKDLAVDGMRINY